MEDENHTWARKTEQKKYVQKLSTIFAFAFVPITF